MHGSDAGVQLTDGHFLTWNDLRAELQPLATMMNGGLLICMSCCFGAHGCRMAMYEGVAPTFWAIVGHYGKAMWSDTAIAYISFYHLFFKGRDLEASVRGMKEASGDAGFLCMYGAATKQDWEARLTALQEEALRKALLKLGSLADGKPTSLTVGEEPNGEGLSSQTETPGRVRRPVKRGENVTVTDNEEPRAAQYLPPFPHRCHTIELRGPFHHTGQDGEPLSYLKILRDGQEVEGGMLFFKDEEQEETIDRAQWIVDRFDGIR
jgi:hypothetical protein